MHNLTNYPVLSLLAISSALMSTSADAALTSYNPNGVDLVYSSVSDVTWTKDANLLGSLIQTQGYSSIVNAIINASPTITNVPNVYSPTGIYTIGASEFSDSQLGKASWFGAMAFVNYLNSISYAGSNNWLLPTYVYPESNSGPPPDFGYPNNGTTGGNEYVELFYNELNGTGNSPIPNTAFFNNVQAGYDFYWTRYEKVVGDTEEALTFFTHDGRRWEDDKNVFNYAWAIAPGTVAVIPEPESLAMLLTGLGLIGFSVRRKHHN